jgi:hypothetical protein
MSTPTVMEMRQGERWVMRLRTGQLFHPNTRTPKQRILTSELTPVRPPLVLVASLIKLYVPLPSDRIAQHVFPTIPSIHRVNSSGDKRTSYNSFLQLLLTLWQAR